MLEAAKVVANFLVGISWPVAIVALALMFRDELRRKFSDLLEAGPGGIKFNPTTQPARIEVDRSGELRNFPALPRTPFIESVERSLLQELDVVKENDVVPLLVRNLAQSRIERAFESIWSNIFSSQIDLLLRLQRSGGSIKLGSAELHFDAAKHTHPEQFADWNFSQWFAYLQRNQLAQFEDNDVVITEIGREFIAFLNATKFGMVRPL